MNAETWLPILTLILGWAGAQITDLIRDRRTNDRERQIRRSEMQRESPCSLLLVVPPLVAGLPGGLGMLTPSLWPSPAGRRAHADASHLGG